MRFYRHLFFIGLSFLLTIQSCMQSEVDTSAQRQFDYEGYRMHQFRKMSLQVKLPQMYTSFEFDPVLMDSLMKANTQPGARDRTVSAMIANMYNQRENKLETFVNKHNNATMVIEAVPYTPIAANVGAQLVGILKNEVREMNRYALTPYHIEDKTMVVGGRVNYMRFVVVNETNSVQMYVITRDMNTWRMIHYGPDGLDYEAILNSVKILKS